MNALNEEYRPTRELRRAAGDALEDYMTFKMLGEKFPQPGGYDEQPAEWVDAIASCTYAMQRVESEVQAEEEKKAREDSKKRK